jgi:hypothetical protein
MAINKSYGKKRLILYLSELNTFVDKKKVRFEDWTLAFNYFTENCFLCKFDLKSGYYHIDLYRKQLTFFSFCWKDQFYSLNVLVFGLTSAPYIFTKCLRPLVKYCRSHGIDGLGFGHDYEHCLKSSFFLLAILLQKQNFWLMKKSQFFSLSSQWNDLVLSGILRIFLWAYHTGEVWMRWIIYNFSQMLSLCLQLVNSQNLPDKLFPCRQFLAMCVIWWQVI